MNNAESTVLKVLLWLAVTVFGLSGSAAVVFGLGAAFSRPPGQRDEFAIGLATTGVIGLLVAAGCLRALRALRRFNDRHRA